MFKYVRPSVAPRIRVPRALGSLRGASKKAPLGPDKKVSWDELAADPRPPWVYTASAALRLVLIPSAFLYAVFFADFGENEHVFMPPRRWLERQKAAFFTLSPAEQTLSEGAADTQPSAVKPSTEPAFKA